MDSRPTSNLSTGSLLAYNTIVSLIGQVLPLLVGVLTTPFIVSHLGEESFGVLSLGWTVLSMSLIFNLGLGRAATKYAAELLGQEDSAKFPSLVWLAVAANSLLGAIVGLLLAGGSDWLVTTVLRIPATILPDAIGMFVGLAWAMPFLFATTTLRGVLEAGQRFGLVNLVKIVFTTLIFILPALAIALDLNLAAIGMLLALSRVFETLAYFAACLRIYPVLWQRRGLTTEFLKPLFTYGGWLTVSSVLQPIFVHFDRFLIGSLISISAVSFYTVPVDLTTRLAIIPGSLVLPLFPAFSALNHQGKRDRVIFLHMGSTKYVLLLLGLVAGGMIPLARPIMSFWLGDSFAENSTIVLQIMALGTLINGLSYLPYTVLQSVGRPDLTAKFHLLEVPIALFLFWYLVRQFGIAGAAMAWTIRVLLDTALLVAATCVLRYLDKNALLQSRVLYSGLLVGLFFMVMWSITFVADLSLRIGLVLIAIILYSALVWLCALDHEERHLVSSMLWRFVRLRKKNQSC